MRKENAEKSSILAESEVGDRVGSKETSVVSYSSPSCTLLDAATSGDQGAKVKAFSMLESSMKGRNVKDFSKIPRNSHPPKYSSHI